MNEVNDTGSTAPLNFGSSSPFTSGQTEPLMDAPSEVPAEAPVEAVVPTPEVDTATTVTEVAAVEEAVVTPAEASVEEVPVVETPVTPQTELVAEVSKELEVHAGNTSNTAVPDELPVIASTTDADIDNAIKERDALNAKIEENQRAQRQDVLAQIKQVIQTYKIPLAEVGEYLGIKGTRKGSKAKPKYRNPADGKEWSGRGKEPLWIKGKDRTGFLITK